MTTASPITQTRSRTDGSGQSILAILLLTSGILLGCFTIYVCFAIQWRGPFRDLWEFVGLVNQMLDGNWDIDALIEPYGGIHRIALPKLLFYLDYRFAAGSNWLAMIFILVVHSCAALLFLRSAAITQHARHDKFVLAALALWCFYSTTQIYNLIYVSDYQVPLSNALCVLAAWWFACVFHHHKFSWLFIINAVIIVASFSHASALMLWPAVIAVGFAQQLPQRWLLAQLLLMAIVIALYVSGHDPLHAGNETLPISSKLGAGIFSALHNLPSLLRYIGLHLGSPLSRDYPVTGIIISYLTVAYVSWLLVCVRNKKQHSSKSDIFWLTIACYGIFIAIITAWGRQIYPNSALTDRYQTLVMTYRRV